MTTLRQIKNLAVPLIARHSDLVLIGRIIVLKPVQHLLRYIFIDRTSDADQPNPRWSLTDFLRKLDDIPVGLGELLHRRDPVLGKHVLWAWSDPTMPEAFINVVEHVALPKLRTIQTLQDFRNFVLPANPAHWKHYWRDRLRCGLALGNLDEVRQVLAETPDGVTWLDRHRAGLGSKLLTFGPDVTPENRAEIAGLLHEWEAYSVHKLNLGKVWERTPFPIELGS